TLLLSDAGALAATSGITVNGEGVLKLDNTAVNNNNRINNGAGLTLTGGTLWFVGNGTTASQEALGALTLSASGSYTDTIRVDYGGVLGQSLQFTGLTQNSGATLSLLSNRTFALGVNEVRVAGAIASTGGIIPYATVTTNVGGPGEQVDLVADLDA